MSKIEQPLGDVARRIKNIADDAIVGYRGSVASGVKHSTQGSFDPNDFDLDGFIVSDKLAARAPLRRFRDGGAIPDIGEEAKRIEELLKESFPGYRVNIERPFTFRIWTRQEFDEIVKGGPHVTF